MNEKIIKFKKSAEKNIFFIDFLKVIELVEEGCSFIRYGDGEVKLAFKKRDIYFQKYEEKLGDLLKEALLYDNPKLLIGLMNVSINYKYFYKCIHTHLINNKVYFNSLDTRHPSNEYTKKLINIWNNRNVCVIHNSFNRHIKNTFKNTKKLIFIKCSHKHTFSIYDKLKNDVLKLPKDYLVCVFAGPTATVLCYELFKEGYQTLDLGRFYKRYRNIE